MNILIDDDKLIHASWNLKAKLKQVPLRCFYDVESFLSSGVKAESVSALYIDSDLKLEMMGESYAKDLFELGYQNLFLVTSFQDLNLQSLPWLKGILTKRPPF